MTNKKPTYEELENRVLEQEKLLAKTLWLTDKDNLSKNNITYVPTYGDVTQLNTERTILDNLGKDTLKNITSELMDLLDTSVAVYEKNGDYAYGVFNSRWCQLLDASSRKLCHTNDNKTALNCGKWLCHEDCWNNSAKAAIISKKSTDIKCVGGIKLYCVPIFVGNEIVGAINIGYGNPPTDKKSLKDLSEKFNIDYEIIKQKAKAYKPRPDFIVEVAKKRLKSIAKLIGEIISGKLTEKKLVERVKELNCISQLSELSVNEDNIKNVLIQLVDILKNSWLFPEITEVKISNNDYTYQTENFKESQWMMNSDIVIDGKVEGEIVVVCLENKIKDANPFLKEEYILLKIVSEQLGKIIERKIAQKQINEKNEQLETIIKGVRLGWWDWDISTGFEKYNDILVENLGYKLEEISPNINWWKEKVHPDDLEKLDCDLQKHLDGNNDFFENKHRIKTKSGQWKWFLDFGKVVERNSKGKPIRMIGMLRDVDYEQRAKEKINDSLQKIKVINANTPNIIWKSDIVEPGRYVNTYISGVVDEFLALPKGTISNSWEKYFSYVLPEYLPLITNAFKETADNLNKLVSIDYEVRRADGKLAWFSSSGRAVYENNKITVYGSTIDVTQKRKAQKDIEISEDKYRKIVDGSIQGLIIAKNNPVRFCYVSKPIEEISGYSVSELMSFKPKDIQSLIHPDHRERFFRDFNKRFSRKNFKKRNEYKIIKKNNTVSWVEMFSSIIEFEGEVAIQIVFVDITERKNAEQALRDSEASFKNMFERHDAIMLLIEPETGQIINANNSAVRFYGYEKSQLCSIKIDQLNTLSLKQIEIELKKVVDEDRNYFIFPHRLANGEIRTVQVHSSAIDYQNKKVLFSIIDDITERKEAEDAIKENELRLKSLVAIFQKESKNKRELLDMSINEAVKLTGSMFGSIYFYNSKAKQFATYSRSVKAIEECFIKSPQNIYNLEDVGIWGEAVRQKKPIVINDYQADNPLKRGYPEGHLKLYNFISVPIFIDGDIVAVVGLANKQTDYTQTDVFHLSILMKNTWSVFQKMEKDEFIKKQNYELVKLNQDKDKFISILAHDLKNPFSTLFGFSQLLSRNVRKYNIDKIEKYVDVINDTAHHTYNLLKEILLWNKAQSGKIVFQPNSFNFNELCKSVIEEISSQALPKSITIKCKLSDNINAFTDINLVKTVMRNLISNAIKYTSNGGKVTLDAKKTENEIIVSIEDNGIGIEKDILPKLFDVLINNSTKGTNSEEGTGLGLQICKDFVEKMGGKIWAESEVGVGSVFYFTIPIKRKNNVGV